MCGFIGFSINESKKIEIINKKFQTFLNKMNHRGPDFVDTISYKNKHRLSNFGFCRLSIQDLDKKANKIFQNDKFCLLFNGEIYNKEFLKKKYFLNKNFETKTDTELLFHLIINYSFEKIHEIEGIFSFVFIDFQKNKISLIRDYTGTKPLFFTIENKDIYFSSEAWFLYSISKKKLDLDVCNFYFKYGFSMQKRTLVKDVSKVAPNTILHFCLSTGKTVREKILKNLGNSKSNLLMNKNSNKDIVENVIKKNMIGDKKIGVFLSGGLDSSIISIIAKKLNPNIEAFTSIYEDYKNQDNQDYEITKKLCKDFSIKLNVNLLKKKDMYDGQDFLNSLNFIDEPIANLNFYSSYKQSQMAKSNGIDVILTGDGADEIYGGYRKYKTLHIANKFKKFQYLNKKLRQYQNINNEDLPYHFFKKFSQKFSKNIFKKDFYEKIENNNSHLFNEKKFENQLSCINFFDFKYWLTDEHNAKLDKATMANSIEGRVPFQDIEILNNFNYNQSSKNNNLFKNKIFLRQSFENIPNYVLNRKKQGWFLPEQNLLNDLFKENIFEIFSIQNYEKSIFNYKKIYEYYFTQKISKLPRYQFVTLLFFEIWYNKMINC